MHTLTDRFRLRSPDYLEWREFHTKRMPVTPRIQGMNSGKMPWQLHHGLHHSGRDGVRLPRRSRYA